MTAPELPKLCRDCRHFRGEQSWRIFTLGYKNKYFYEFAKCALEFYDPPADFVRGASTERLPGHASVSRKFGPCGPSAKLFEAKP